MIVEIRDDVIALSGALRQNHWPTLESAVRLRLRHHPNGIVVDSSGITHISAQGAETFRDAAFYVEARGGRLVFAGLAPQLMTELRLIPSLGSRLPLAHSVDDGRASLGLPVPTQTQSAEPATMVALLGTSGDIAAVGAAQRLAENRDGGARIHLIYPLLVPRDRPLLSALGPEEEEVRRQLDRFDTALRERGFQTLVRVERTRDRARRILEIAGETNATRLVIGLAWDANDAVTQVAEMVLRRSANEVLVLHQGRRKAES